MLRRDELRHAGPAGGSATGDGEPPLLRVLLRQKWKILAAAIVALGPAILVVDHLPARYTAQASVALDSRQFQLLANSDVVTAPQLDLDRLRTEMESFQEPAVAEAVVQDLDLTHDQAFCARDRHSVSDIMSSMLHRRTRPTPVPGPCSTSRQQALKTVTGSVSFSNDGRSYIVHVQATAGTPEMAARLANGYAHAYVERQWQIRRQDTQRADDWLLVYLAKLREQTRQSDLAVAQYREQHRLTPLQGGTLASQSLAELNSQLTLATSDLAEKRSMLRQVEGLEHAGGSEGSAPALASPVIQSLLEKQAGLMTQEAELRSRYGDAHPMVQAAEAEIARLNQQIRLETAKSVSGLTGEVAALSGRESTLSAQVQALESHAAEEGQQDVRLDELLRDADANRQLYQTVLVRLKEVGAEQGVQQAGAHVVVDAVPPEVASFPRRKMMIVGSFMAALAVAAAVAVLASFLSRRFEDVAQVEQETGLSVLGLFPRPKRRQAPCDIVVDQPMSLEAESLQAILIGLGEGRPAADGGGRIVMVISALPEEGKSSFVLALGRAAARSSLSVALLDCDLRRPSLGRLTGARTSAGTPSQEVVDMRSGLHVIPMSSFVRNPHQLLAPGGAASVVDRLRSTYDIVIIDTPPVLAVPDALKLAPLADDVLLLASWSDTSRRALGDTLDRLQRNGVSPSGIVLSKVDLRRFGRFAGRRSYYTQHYPGYTDKVAFVGARV